MSELREMLVIRPDKGMEKLTVRRLEVFRAIAKELGEQSKRVDYNKIAKTVGMTYNGVRYAVGGLLKAKLLGVKNGELYVIKKSVL